MVSFLVLIAWMGLGILSAWRIGPSGAAPIAVFFGPLWPAIASEMSPTPATVEHDLHRGRVAGIDSAGDR